MIPNLTLKAPGDERNFFTIPGSVADLQTPFNGNVLCQSGRECEIKENIIHYINTIPNGVTLAQRSNFIPITATIYEAFWRKKSIGILSGEEFSLEDEKKLLQTWISPQKNEWIADIGCSTGFYARSIAEREPLCNVIALDFSQDMLKQASNYIQQERHNIFLLKADAETLPFYAENMDALVCGGTLNEFANPEKVLYEMKRVLKPGGRCFIMHLLKASSWYGNLLQKSSELGGLHFWDADESASLFEKAGFTIHRKHRIGIVHFSLLQLK